MECAGRCVGHRLTLPIAGIAALAVAVAVMIVLGDHAWLLMPGVGWVAAAVSEAFDDRRTTFRERWPAGRQPTPRARRAPIA